MNRIKKGMVAAVWTSAFLMGGMSMQTFAQTGIEADCICEEKCQEETRKEECSVCKEHPEMCQGTEKEAVESTAENVDNERPLTPDGNLTLVDDYGSPSRSGKQFLTVVTKSGNYFYLIIDRDDQGEETVHFLNMVDEADLLRLMEEDSVKAYREEQEAKKEEETVPEETAAVEPEPENPKPKKGMQPTLLLLVMFLSGVGIVGGYLFIKKKKMEPKKPAVDPDFDYREDEDYLESLKLSEEPDMDIPDEDMDDLSAVDTEEEV